MTLREALAVLQPKDRVVSSRDIFMVCGFEPLHLATFLKAHFALRFPDSALNLLHGLYGDLDGNLMRAAQSSATEAVVIIEWPDLDSRLSLRGTGGWGVSVERDILSHCATTWTALLGKLRNLASRMPVALASPTLPFSLFGSTAGWQISSTETELNRQTAEFLADAAQISNVRILHPSRLARLSPERGRREPNIELAAGFPYSNVHASTLAEQLIQLLYPPAPMKGLITDLDDTLWSGIVGEVGPGAVSWGLSERSQLHGLYQQELLHLSQIGVLLGVASKNEPALVKEALLREDLRVSGSAFFPIQASWGPKSAAVAEILQVWNIGADSVVFVDDSQMELEEVRTAFPSMTCLLFPKQSAAKVLDLCEQLRDLFGKPQVQREDALRQSSIRTNALFQNARQSASPEFIRDLCGKLTFDSRPSGNKRILELINKTNQFNLNGLRLGDGEWQRHFENGAGFAVAVDYEDRFGPLGIIGAIVGIQIDSLVEVHYCVLSCRAFSRRIEHHMLDYLFSVSGAKTVRLMFRPTERNTPLQEFLRGLTSDLSGPFEVSEAMWSDKRDELPHEVRKLQ